MKRILIGDSTMKQTVRDLRLTFKERLELAKHLDKLGADLIELEPICDPRVDSLLVKSIVSAVSGSRIAIPVELLSEASLERTVAAIKNARNPRLQVVAPMSAVQIEYLYHMKPDAMLDAIGKTVAACAAVSADVELVADDATRSEADFLARAVKTAVDAGASTVTLCDTAGVMLPSELADFITTCRKTIPALDGVTLGVSCSDALAMADASAVAAIGAGAGYLRAAAYTESEVSLESITRILSAKGDSLGVCIGVNATGLSTVLSQVKRFFRGGAVSVSAAASEDDGIYLTAHDGEEAVAEAVARLGYELSAEDAQRVYAAFRQIADRKDKVSSKELDAIVASAAMQVPSVYKLDTYVITSGNTISATAHIKLTKNGEPVEGVYIGDGSIDAAFQAIEKMTGCSCELDDFQLQAVTEGREAMGQTLVKLRSGGKVYSGIGISTDIVGAGIAAYLSALNKIVYEEEAVE